MADFALLVNGVDLSRWRVLAGTSWRPTVRMRRSPVRVPGRHGTRSVTRRLFDEATGALELLVPATTQAELEAEVNTLLGLLGSASLTLVRQSAGLETSAVVELESIAPGDFVEGGYARVTAIFAVPGVFFRAAETTFSVTAVTGGANFEIVHFSGSTAPIVDAKVRVQIGATPPASGTLTVTDVGSGTGFTIESALTANRHVYVDCATHRAWTSTSSSTWSPTDSGAADISGWVAEFPQGMLELTPYMPTGDPTARRVRVAVSVGSSSVSVRGRAAYL